MAKKTKDFIEPVQPIDSPPQKTYQRIAVVFIAAAVVLIVGVAYLVLAKAVITLAPADEPINKSFALTVAENPVSNTSTNPVIGGKIYLEKVTGEAKYPVSDDGQVVEEQAEGEVIIYNKRSGAQTLVATTRLLAKENVLFRLQDKVVVPANGSIKAKIYADKAGKSGEIKATTFTIPGLSPELQKLVYAESSAPTAGGEKKIGSLNQTDIDKAMADFKQNNLEKIVAKLTTEMTGDDWVLIGAKIAEEGQNFSYDKKIGDKTTEFTLNGEMTVAAVTAEKAQILDQAKTKLLETVVNGQGTINLDPNSLKYELTEINPEKKEATAAIAISGMVNFDPTKDIFDKNILVGFTEDDLKLYFSQFEAVKNVRVEFSPFWVKKVPILKDHIVIQIQNAQ